MEIGLEHLIINAVEVIVRGAYVDVIIRDVAMSFLIMNALKKILPIGLQRHGIHPAVQTKKQDLLGGQRIGRIIFLALQRVQEYELDKRGCLTAPLIKW